MPIGTVPSAPPSLFAVLAIGSPGQQRLRGGNLS